MERKDYSPEQDTLISIADYLLLEEGAEYKSEFEGGKVIRMAGGSVPHETICFNLHAALHQQLQGTECRGFGSNLKIGIEEAGRYYYPDALVVCGDLIYGLDRKDIITNPTVIVEVFSDSTQHRDRGEKFRHYRLLPSFQEYVLISQEQLYVEVFAREDERIWKYQAFSRLTDKLRLAAPGIEILLETLYEQVDFE